MSLHKMIGYLSISEKHVILNKFNQLAASTIDKVFFPLGVIVKLLNNMSIDFI